MIYKAYRNLRRICTASELFKFHLKVLLELRGYLECLEVLYSPVLLYFRK